MPDVSELLEACFVELSNEYDIEKVDEVPHVSLEKRTCAPSWRILVPASVKGKAEDIEMYMSFPRAFPYVMPWVFIPEDSFRYFPHISPRSRKLCLFEDGIVYEERDISYIVRMNIRKARQWVERYSGNDCTDEYADEIVNYWSAQYDEEELVDDSPVFFGEIPTQSCSVMGFAYPVKNLKDNSLDPQLVFYTSEDTCGIKNIKESHKTIEILALFLASIEIPVNPPCSMTALDLIERIGNMEDRKLFRQLVNKNKKCYILFPIGSNHMLGGVFIDQVKLKRQGFRAQLTPYEVHGMFENKNKKLERFIAYQYNDIRIAERTAGGMMKARRFIVAGLGSIGSNLCYYLNGYNNAQFALIDNDCLSADNIGRHLLGFEYINQSKVLAVKKFLQSYRPDREVNVFTNLLQNIPSERINEGDALFICIGDEMIERWVLNKVESHEIKIPLFVFWLEPYAISGIMLYVNPDDSASISRLKALANDSFFDYCLISRDEYAQGDKLTHRDAGCNGMYALYSANDVTFFLSAMFHHIDSLLSKPECSKCYQWIGNLEIANQKGIQLTEKAKGSKKNEVVELAL